MKFISPPSPSALASVLVPDQCQVARELVPVLGIKVSLTGGQGKEESAGVRKGQGGSEKGQVGQERG